MISQSGTNRTDRTGTNQTVLASDQHQSGTNQNVIIGLNRNPWHKDSDITGTKRTEIASRIKSVPLTL